MTTGARFSVRLAGEHPTPGEHAVAFRWLWGRLAEGPVTLRGISLETLPDGQRHLVVDLAG